jgi:hypothetical protein
MAGDYLRIFERLIEAKSRTRAPRVAEAAGSLAVRANGEAASHTNSFPSEL